MTVINTPPQHQSSVDTVSDVLDRVIGIGARERQLDDRELDGEPMTDQERAG